MQGKRFWVGLAALVLLLAGRSDAGQSMRGVRIVDTGGVAVVGLSLSIFPEKASAGLFGIGGSTDTNGIFRFAQPRGVIYGVRASPSLDSAYYGTGIVPVIDDSEGAKNSLVTIQVRRCATVQGQVVDAAGNPLSRVKVVCETGKETYDADSGSDGHFRMYLVCDEGAATVYGYDDRKYVVDKVTVDLGSASNLVLVAHEKKTLDVHCRIVSITSGGRVIVPYCGASNLRGPVGYMHDITNGDFVLPRLIPGEYILNLNGLHAQGLYLKNPSFKVCDGTATVDFIVEPLRSLSLVVKDKDSDGPISNATVYVEQDGQRSSPLKTDEAGKVVLPVRPVSKETKGLVRIDHTEYMSSQIALPEADESIVRLSRGATLNGRVTDDGGKPISNVTVVVKVDGMGERVARTDKLGKFEMSRLLLGEVSVIVAAEGYAPTSIKMRLPAKEPIQAVLYPGIPVTFSVAIEATGALGERIRKGTLVLIDKRTAIPVGFLPAVTVTRKELRMNAGKYDVLCLLDGEWFHVDSVEVTGPGSVPITVKELGKKTSIHALGAPQKK